MSCAVLTVLPNGGRRSTNSSASTLIRYVRFEEPAGNCETSTSHVGLNNFERMNSDNDRSSNSSPARTFVASLLTRDSLASTSSAMNKRGDAQGFFFTIVITTLNSPTFPSGASSFTVSQRIPLRLTTISLCSP